VIIPFEDQPPAPRKETTGLRDDAKNASVFDRSLKRAESDHRPLHEYDL
jgi:hypothetical protein